MRWENFLSQFPLHIAHVPGKLNPVANALSWRPTSNAVTIAHQHDFTNMLGKYTDDEDFANVFKELEQGGSHENFSLTEGFLMYDKRLCITKDLREKVMVECHEPPYAGHWGIRTTMQAIETYFY